MLISVICIHFCGIVALYPRRRSQEGHLVRRVALRAVCLKLLCVPLLLLISFLFLFFHFPLSYCLPAQEGVNRFTDRTEAEMKQLLGYKKSLGYARRAANNVPSSLSSEDAAAMIAALPTSVDWREKGAVTPVKDQGQCGMSCLHSVWMHPLV